MCYNAIFKLCLIFTPKHGALYGRFLVTLVSNMSFNCWVHFVTSIAFHAAVIFIINFQITVYRRRFSTTVILSVSIWRSATCKGFSACLATVFSWKKGNSVKMFWKNASISLSIKSSSNNQYQSGSVIGLKKIYTQR